VRSGVPCGEEVIGLPLPIFAKLGSLGAMGTMNVSLPDALKEFVEGQVAERGYGTSSEYVRELIRHDRDRQSLRALVMEGARSAPSGPADAAWFEDLRGRIRQAAGG
jgi:antitoxin ParD1/3/4